MIISYNWLQTYFKEKLPSADKVAELLVFHSFEVESVEKTGDDFIFDIKILPDRAHDCLSHRGLAHELSVHLGIKTAEEKKSLRVSEEKPKRELKVNVNEPALCRRYTGLMIEGINVGPSPDWLKNRMGSIGQKSINNVVDATNFLMFDLGQPLHAFDADKTAGDISVRNSNNGEKITTLDGKEVSLDSETLVIADNKESLAIAGIKGGKKAEVNASTENIILEAANFSPTNIRKTSKRLGIQTDSSKRFENELSADKTKEAIEAAANLILDIAGNSKTKIGNIVDVYPRPPAPYVVGASVQEINRVLGASVTREEIEPALERLNFKYKIVAPSEEVVSLSQKLAGTPYKYGASVVYDAPRAFDCSSFIAYLFAQAGVAVPRMAVDQHAFGEKIKESEIKSGDVIFSNTGEGKIYYETVEFIKGNKIPEGVDHCGLYLGDGKIIHATRYKKEVIIENLASSEQFKNIVGYRRMANDEKRFAVTVPPERLDIRIKEDLIEEIGRNYGYDKISAAILPATDAKALVNKSFFYANKIRDILAREGFSEVFTSSFTDSGKVAVENPIASDKGFLRSDLKENMFKSLELNLKNAPLLGLTDIRIFEIGKVFSKVSEENTSLAIGVCGKKSKEVAQGALETLANELGSGIKGDTKQVGDKTVIEINIDAFFEKLPEPKNYSDALAVAKDSVTYRKISPYPFIGRDIALWVPGNIESETVLEILKEKSGELLAKIWLFDVFKKDGKISYAFRLVFQSHEKTLTDDEVNEVMNKIYAELGKRGWQIR